MNEQSLEPTENIALLQVVDRAGHLINGRLESGLAVHGLSRAKFGVLRHLVLAGGTLSLGQLAERLACVKSNITQLIDRLEAEGLVERIQDPDDRRSMRATITDEGKKRYADGVRAERQVETELLRCLTETEQKQLTSLLERFLIRR